jgi:hypothetical protein
VHQVISSVPQKSPGIIQAMKQRMLLLLTGFAFTSCMHSSYKKTVAEAFTNWGPLPGCPGIAPALFSKLLRESIGSTARPEQLEHARLQYRTFRDQAPQGFWARLFHDQIAALHRQGVTHLAVRVPASDQVRAGWMLVDIHNGKPARKVYELACRRLKPGTITSIDGHDAFVYRIGIQKSQADR